MHEAVPVPMSSWRWPGFPPEAVTSGGSLSYRSGYASWADYPITDDCVLVVPWSGRLRHTDVAACRERHLRRAARQTPQENPMQIQFNTDVNINGTEALAAQVAATVEQALERFSEHITRVEIHLRDENGDKNGQHDHRCMLEARLEGRKPLAVTDHAATVEQAVHGAARKMVNLLDSTLGRPQDRRDKASNHLPLSGTGPAPH
jgi:hypothetical protein